MASLDDDKAEEVIQIDLRGRSDVADYMVICSGRSSRQVASISDKLSDRLKDRFKMGAKMEGKEGPWQLKVTVNKEDGLAPWVAAVSDVTKLALTQTSSLKDVMDIFKLNRNIFDVLKIEAPEDYSKVMEEFTTFKQSFSKKD
jgi:ribosome silencing factor RsfS/YbeB/iojap